MRFVCDSCRAQYMISDDKVGPKGVKVRCKKCGYVILVRPLGEASASADESEERTQIVRRSSLNTNGAEKGAPPTEDPSAGGGVASPSTLGQKPEGDFLGGVEDDEIGAVFDQVLSNNASPKPASPSVELGDDDQESTKVLDGAALRKLAADAEAAAQDGGGESSSTEHEWFVAIDEKQTGPLNLEKMKLHWERGEIGPDSLCWRAGFSDWLPLSEISELASVLAPRPSSPVIVAPAAVAGPQASVMTVPVESAFSAGGVTRTVRSEIAVLTPSAPAAKEDTGWKPSAASVLASLVKEEGDALAKPPPRPASTHMLEEKASVPGLLDVPAAEHSSPRVSAAAPLPVVHERQAPREPERSPYVAAPYAPYNPNQNNKKTGLIIGSAVGAVLLLAVGGTATYMMTRPTERPVEVAQATPVVPPPAAAAVAPPAAAVPTPAPVAAAPTPAPAPEPVAAAEPPREETRVARAEPRESSGGRRERGTRTRPEPAPVPAPAPVAAPARNAKVVDLDDGSDEDFDELFGPKKGKRAAADDESPKEKKRATTTYVPPAPGAVDLPDQLGQADIMQVVLSNKPAIVKCVNEQKKKDPDLSGRLVMRWTISPSGRTSGVSCQTDEFRSSHMASCVTALIKSWSFPRHKEQGDPINFPFTF